MQLWATFSFGWAPVVMIWSKITTISAYVAINSLQLSGGVWPIMADLKCKIIYLHPEWLNFLYLSLKMCCNWVVNPAHICYNDKIVTGLMVVSWVFSKMGTSINLWNWVFQIVDWQLIGLLHHPEMYTALYLVKYFHLCS